MKIKKRVNVYTLGKSVDSDRISVGAIVGISCHAADGPALLMEIKIKKARPLGNRISKVSLSFLCWGSSSPWKDTFFSFFFPPKSFHIQNHLGEWARGRKRGNIMPFFVTSFTIELRQKHDDGVRDTVWIVVTIYRYIFFFTFYRPYPLQLHPC